MPLRIAVLGGAGFLGSHIAEAFANRGDHVLVIDGLIPGTGGVAGHLAPLAKKVEFIRSKVEAIPDLGSRLEAHDVIVDAMGWTRHHDAIQNPGFDLALNTQSHLCFLTELTKATNRHARVIYLGSRGQFGSAPGRELGDEAPQVPEDIQGAHKALGESYFRAFSRSHGLTTLSLRIGNCFGTRQVKTGKDIGLIGGMIREALRDRTITVFSPTRTRPVCYAPDLANAVVSLGTLSLSPGFHGLNYPGREVTVGELAHEIAGITGAKLVEAEMPEAVRAVEMSGGRFFSDRLERWLGTGFSPTSLAEALRETVAYFGESHVE